MFFDYEWFAEKFYRIYVFQDSIMDTNALVALIFLLFVS